MENRKSVLLISTREYPRLVTSSSRNTIGRVRGFHEGLLVPSGRLNLNIPDCIRNALISMASSKFRGQGGALVLEPRDRHLPDWTLQEAPPPQA